MPVIVPRLVIGGLRCAVPSFLAADQGFVRHAGPDWIIAHSQNGPPAADVNEESRPRRSQLGMASYDQMSGQRAVGLILAYSTRKRTMETQNQ